MESERRWKVSGDGEKGDSQSLPRWKGRGDGKGEEMDSDQRLKVKVGRQLDDPENQK